MGEIISEVWFHSLTLPFLGLEIENPNLLCNVKILGKKHGRTNLGEKYAKLNHVSLDSQISNTLHLFIFEINFYFQSCQNGGNHF